MRGFQARNIMFCSVDELGATEERVIWRLKLRHLLYLGLAGMFLAMGVNGGIFFFAIGLPLGILSIIAALYPNEALSFEAVACGVINYFLFRKKERRVVSFPTETKIRSMRRSGNEDFTLQVEISPEEFENEEEEVAEGFSRIVLETKRKDVKKI